MGSPQTSLPTTYVESESLNGEQFTWSSNDEKFSNEYGRMRHNSTFTELPRTPSINTPQQFAKALNIQDYVKADTPASKSELTLYDSYSNTTVVNLHTGYAVQSINDEYLIVQIDEDEKRSKYSFAPKAVQREENGLYSSTFIKQATLMSLWFFCSFGSILLNKYILSTLDVDAAVLGETQILMTTFYGGVMMYLPICHSMKTSEKNKSINKYQFFITISLLGWLRCGAIICSVIGLKYVAVSFSETIKSSAPLFTAIVAYLLLGEYSGMYVNLSLLPVMFGLAIATSTELSFNMTGFVAAITNNILDCIQNVFSKKLLTGTDLKFTPLELQFYTSVAATTVQMPLWFYFMGVTKTLQELDSYTIYMLLLNSVIFYLQSLFAYSLMSLISPVTFSVSNTVKRACLIWFSVLVFGNKLSWISAFGTALVVLGVFLYQRARHVEAATRHRLMKENQVTKKQNKIIVPL